MNNKDSTARTEGDKRIYAFMCVCCMYACMYV